jgi:phytoene synthase
MAMRGAMARFRLPRRIVEGVIDAQADVLHGERPVDERALQARLATSEGGLFRLALRICTEADDDPRTAERAGLAYGLARALAHVRADGAAWLLIPRSLVADEDLASGSDSDASRDAHVAPALVALARKARAAHADVSSDIRRMSRRRRLAFLPLAMVRPNLRALEKGMNQPGGPPSDPLSLGRLVRIGWAHASGRV